ncbi:Outer membrane protein assembly factor BamB, contains PQQ-like beta-propeller repeat [Paenibacillus sp. UNCCL117]|uniref:outer membrane protein assembly factor BamB family protein n=1 Tax=unclassified Paenibacillus TaxID=185978 RepID=UPI00088E1C67|nr:MULTISPECIES: PQQ-binding-like beta-propeller repeat protein [unclassified Paenibacillus]SDE49284.1 Outer membrane protein assembly factor BamB, contains PQQ-like beta-propeller repeat [Paenibacillus sp. cl123]SFW66852.1 Outer membrane protein assembly factor BamB, contains PQQ-like beta-propeller repeat [Paenibacillus sp. UNCCL117]
MRAINQLKRWAMVGLAAALLLQTSGELWPREAQASGLPAYTQALRSFVPGAISLTAGTLASGTAAQLAQNDQQYMQFASALSGSEHKVAFTADLALASPGAATQSLRLELNGKASATGGTAALELWNNATSAWEAVSTAAIGTGDTPIRYATSAAAAIAGYVSGTNVLKARVTISRSAAFTGYWDYFNAVTETAAPSGWYAASYPAAAAALENGTVSANTAAKLADRDKSYFSVQSDGANKVAWASTVTLAEPASSVKTLVVRYAGKYSAAANTTWISLWNYTTGNWDTVYDADSTTAYGMVEWSTSDPALIGKFVSAHNDVQLRLYNSGSGSFVRDADALDVTAYYAASGTTTKTFAPDTVTAEFGTITSGNAASLEQIDANPLVMAASVDKKLAWNAEATLTGVDPLKVRTLSVFTKAGTSSSVANNLFLSFWNYKDSSWDVVRTQTPEADPDTFLVTIRDSDLIERYISSAGQVKARLYNSSATTNPAFTRSTDVLSFIVETGDVSTFEFAQLSDVHEPIGHNNFLAIINELNTTIKPAFTVVTGDISDHGTEAQYAQYAADSALLDSTLYTTPGNHDVRWWNSNGKNDFADRIGQLYSSFNYGGVHFVLLDSTVTLELDAKFSRKMLDWLETDLQALPAGMPIVFFAHHPFEIQNNVTGKSELLDLVEDYNVVAYLSGHLHRWGNQIENGVPWVYIGQIKDYQEYTTVKISPNKLTITRRNAANGSSSQYLTAPMNNVRKQAVTITSATAAANGNVTVSVSIPDAPDGVTSVQANVDNYGSWTTLTKGSGNVWTGTVNISGMSPALPFGSHFVAVKMTDGKGGVWKKYKEYLWTGTGGNVVPKWTFQTGGLIQAPPTYANGKVYVGSEDGKLYAIDDATGTQSWAYTTGGSILSSPAFADLAAPDDDVVLVGSGDNKLHAVYASTGTVKWTYETGGNVMSNPVVDSGVVYFGSGDKYIYAVNLSDGSLKWRYLTEGLMRQRPTIQGGKLYANVRDTYVWYALNVSDGSLYWRGNAATDESLFVVGDVEPIYAGGQLWTINPMPTDISTLNPATGAVTWTDSIGNDFSARGGATDGTLVFYPAHGGRQLYAFNATTRSLAWTKDLRAGGTDSDLQEYQIDSGLVYDGGILYHVAERGRITGYDPANGSLKFKYDAVGFPERVLWSTPEVHNKTIYAGGIDGKVYAVTYTGS